MIFTFFFNMIIGAIDQFISLLPSMPTEAMQFTSYFQAFAIINRIIDFPLVIGTLLTFATMTTVAYTGRAVIDWITKIILNLVP